VPIPGAFDVLVLNDRTVTRERQERVYLDARWVPLGPVMLQGQMAYVSSKFDLTSASPIPASDVEQRNRNRIEYRFGGAWEPSAGQWLRAGYSSQTANVLPFTFAPLDSIGLRPNITPSGYSAPYSSVMARWDSEWSAHFFTAVEFQHQQFPFLLIPAPLDQFAAAARRARIDRLSVSANLWLPGNFGLNANYAYADSFGDRSQPNQALTGPLPYVPEHFARLALTWSHPSRLRLSFAQSYLGDQTGILGDPVGDFFSTDATLQWEPFNRHVIVRLDAINILDAKVRQPGFLSLGGRNVAASLAVRF
jgi:outer membrane receptor protein involved in Fe transport